MADTTCRPAVGAAGPADIEVTGQVLDIASFPKLQERRGDLGRWQTVSAAASPVVARIVALNLRGAA